MMWKIAYITHIYSIYSSIYKIYIDAVENGRYSTYLCYICHLYATPYGDQFLASKFYMNEHTKPLFNANKIWF